MTPRLYGMDSSSTPSTEDSGTSFNVSESYPTAFDDSNGEKRISDETPQ
jgi:hypothetical protein